MSVHWQQGLEGLAVMYAAGLVYWWFCVFFRGEHFEWKDVARGLIWPLLWLRWRARR